MIRLYEIYAEGCPGCEATTPEVEKFGKAHPEIKIVMVDIERVEWGARAWEPQVTPTLILLTEAGLYHVREGQTNLGEIEQWVGRCLR
ncbi:MAG: thioredoxin family protein [Dehalococcoidia bacterium]|nr:thioredoxin family protein [Dehalococcoidia bacterium]